MAIGSGVWGWCANPLFYQRRTRTKAPACERQLLRLTAADHISGGSCRAARFWRRWPGVTAGDAGAFRPRRSAGASLDRRLRRGEWPPVSVSSPKLRTPPVGVPRRHAAGLGCHAASRSVCRCHTSGSAWTARCAPQCGRAPCMQSCWRGCCWPRRPCRMPLRAARARLKQRFCSGRLRRAWRCGRGAQRRIQPHARDAGTHVCRLFEAGAQPNVVGAERQPQQAALTQHGACRMRPHAPPQRHTSRCARPVACAAPT